MKEILKRFCALLSLVLMLSLVSAPAFGGDNPWDSDGSSGDSDDSTTGSGESNPDDAAQPMYLGTVYLGIDGLLVFVGQGVEYWFSQFTFLGRSVMDRPDSRTEASQQQDF